MFCPLKLIFFIFITFFFLTLFLLIFTKLYKNMLKLLFLIELLSLNFCLLILFTDYYYGWDNIYNLNVNGQIFVLFILTISALEASIGLALIYMNYKQTQATNIENLNKFKN